MDWNSRTCDMRLIESYNSLVGIIAWKIKWVCSCVLALTKYRPRDQTIFFVVKVDARYQNWSSSKAPTWRFGGRYRCISDLEIEFMTKEGLTPWKNFPSLAMRQFSILCAKAWMDIGSTFQFTGPCLLRGIYSSNAIWRPWHRVYSSICDLQLDIYSDVSWSWDQRSLFGNTISANLFQNCVTCEYRSFKSQTQTNYERCGGLEWQSCARLQGLFSFGYCQSWTILNQS